MWYLSKTKSVFSECLDMSIFSRKGVFLVRSCKPRGLEWITVPSRVQNRCPRTDSTAPSGRDCDFFPFLTIPQVSMESVFQPHRDWKQPTWHCWEFLAPLLQQPGCQRWLHCQKQHRALMPQRSEVPNTPLFSAMACSLSSWTSHWRACVPGRAVEGRRAKAQPIGPNLQPWPHRWPDSLPLYSLPWWQESPREKMRTPGDGGKWLRDNPDFVFLSRILSVVSSGLLSPRPQGPGFLSASPDSPPGQPLSQSQMGVLCWQRPLFKSSQSTDGAYIASALTLLCWQSPW